LQNYLTAIIGGSSAPGKTAGMLTREKKASLKMNAA
jgi:hypothetical protein